MVAVIVHYFWKKPKQPKNVSLSVVSKQAGGGGDGIYSEDVYETPAGINM